MALPAINIRVDANTVEAERGLDRVDNALERVGVQAKSTGAAASNMGSRLAFLGNMSGSTRNKVQQVSFQVQDLAVQLGGGTRASTAFAQQLPQLASAFGAVGAVVGVLAAVGIPALAYAFSSATDEVDDLAEALKNVREETEDAQAAYRAFVLGLGSTDELVIRDKIVALYREEDEIRSKMRSLGPTDLRDAQARLNAIAKETANLEAQLSTREKSRDQYERMLNLTRETTDAERLLGEQLQEVTRQAALAAHEMQVMRDAAMDAAREFTTVQALRSRFAGEDLVMGMPVVVPGRGDPLPKSGGGAATGGGGADGDNRLTTLLESLQTERETLALWYSESLELLNSANATELEAIGGHNEARLRLEQEYQERLRGLRTGYDGDALMQAGQFFGDMAGAMQSGNEKMLRIAKIFGAAQGLINSYQAYTEVLKDPTLPWFARVPAAVSVLSAGLGMVSAIKGVNSGGGGGASGASAAVSAQPNVSRLVTVQFAGEGDTISRKGAIDMINAINEAIEDGARIRVTA